METEIRFDIETSCEENDMQLQTWETQKPITVEEQAREDDKLTVRLDKWLWATRFFKTRALARAAIEKGKVLYNGGNVKASREICLGDKVTLLQGRMSKDIVIVGLSTRRKNADDAQQLYKETSSNNSTRDYGYNNSANYNHTTRRVKSNPNAALPFAPAAKAPSSSRMVEVRNKKSIRFLRRSNKNGELEHMHIINKDY